MRIPSSLIPYCPHCGKPVTMNLRSDDSFVEDEGWNKAAERYADFLQSVKGRRVLFLELGVGYNTPSIIKYPFWGMTRDNPLSVYASVTKGDAVCPGEIRSRSILIDDDIASVIEKLCL